MPFVLAKNWWSLVIRGLAAILLGIVSLAMPGITVSLLVLLFGAYALVDGVVSFVGAWRASRIHGRWMALVLEGIAGLVAGLVTLAWPAITTVALIYIIGFWALVTGVLEISAPIRLRQHVAGEWLLGLAGVASVIFGIALMVYPLAGALVLAVWIGIYALIFGVMLVGLGLRLRGHASIDTPPTPKVRAASAS